MKIVVNQLNFVLHVKVITKSKHKFLNFVFQFIKNTKWHFGYTDHRHGSRGWTRGTGPPQNLTSKVLITTKFLLLFYLHYNQPLLSYFSFISFFNYYLKMVILIVYLTLKAFASLFAFIHLCFISLGVFHIFFDHYIEQNVFICFYSLSSSHWEIFYKIAVQNQC